MRTCLYVRMYFHVHCTYNYGLFAVIPSVWHMSITYQSMGVGKRGAYKNWSMVAPEKTAPITGTTLRIPAPAPADSRQ